jgi:formylglycine-generating enzyme required for sulfatase activity
MAHDVFISYSSADKPRADAVCAALESEGVRCWIAPRDITPGQHWPEAIMDAISNSRLMVLVFSAGSNVSPQILREVERAVNKGLTIITLRVEDVAPSKGMELLLSTPHWLDAMTPPFERHLRRLQETVKLHLSREAALVVEEEGETAQVAEPMPVPRKEPVGGAAPAPQPAPEEPPPRPARPDAGLDTSSLRRWAADPRLLVGGAVAVVVIAIVLVVWQPGRRDGSPTLSALVTATEMPGPTAWPTLAPTTAPALAAGVTRVHEKTGVVLVYVPAGEFSMGAADEDSLAEDDEKPRHMVSLDSFWIAQTELTNDQFSRFVEVGGYSQAEYWTSEGWQWRQSNGIQQPLHWGDQEWNGPQQPVVGVSWHEAVAYASWAGLRLPTEAEWEYAAHGGPSSGGYRYAGSDDPDEVAWYDVNSSQRTHSVGQKKPNELGLHDLSGNVWEWCQDWYNASYFATSVRSNPRGPDSGDSRVLRGGSWWYGQVLIRCTNRDLDAPDARYNNVGFRVAE